MTKYFQLGGVIPDIVTVGKPIANGFPIAAVITRREIAEAYWKSGSQVKWTVMWTVYYDSLLWT